MKCKKCGAVMPDGAFFCGECGALTSEENYGQTQYNEEDRRVETPAVNVYEPEVKKNCPACGSRINSGEKFCPECGHKIGESSVTYIPQPKKSNTGIIVALCAVTVMMFIAIAVVVFMVVKGDFVRNLADNVLGAAATAAPTDTMRPIQTYDPSYNGNSSYGGGGTYANGGTYNSGSSYGEYLFPSDTLYITDNDLRGKSQSEVRYILNEIYARNGYIFNNENYRQYFSSKSWYFGNTTSQQEAESRFNSVETANRNFIISYEKSRGWR